ncbi:MAG: glutamate--tRNA ligase [Verrucomicrobia bacterium]|nr:glutamate--tRNA ligase [Verrucomicrobiota bacterium]MBU1908820.1 glutamate--tRNA ligase [Verrucomicrobiota bacterium]
MTIRTRFAPSPTGHVHIGNIRAAVYGWLFARHEGGQFLLRIEDTDRERSTPEAVRTVLDAMEWMGLTFDEEPLYQSMRMPAHLAAAEQLLAKGLAYREDKGGTGKGEAVVFRMPGTDMAFHDEVKGDLRKKAEDMKDFVIVRSNGTPVFHLANVVDDIHMGITHIIRGDDHVENTYRHLALFCALGAPVPKYAHLPMIINAQGKPYSKRDGAAYVGEFRDKGYLPEALFNYLALLGWSPGDDREIMSREELVRAFTLDRVRSAPSQMDLKKLDWLNGVHMRALPRETLEAGCRAVLERRALWPVPGGLDYLARVVETMGERLHFFTDIADHASYFFTEEYVFDEKAVNKRLKKAGAADALRALSDRLAALDPFNAQTTEQALRALAEERGEGAGVLVHPVRVAVSGSSEGPSLFHMLEVLGKDRVLARIARALEKFAAE